MRITNSDGYALDIVDDAFTKLQALGVEADGKERCAAIVGSVKEIGDTVSIRILNAVEVQNSAEDDERHFEVIGHHLKDAILSEYQEGPVPKLLGFVHTHLLGGPDPSFNDIDGAHPTTLNFVYHVPSSTLTLFTHADGYITKFRWINIRSNA